MNPDYNTLIMWRQAYVMTCQMRGLDPVEADKYFTKRCQELGWIQKVDETA